MVLSVLLARSLGPPRSEVLWDSLLCKRLWAFHDVHAWLSHFSLSPWSLSVLSGLPTLGLSVSWSLEVRGPFRSFLRRRRFPAFSDVRVLVSRSFCGRTLYIWQRSAVLSGLSIFGLSVSRSLEVRGPRTLVRSSTSVDLEYFRLVWILVFPLSYLLTYIRRLELMYAVATGRGHDLPEL